MNKAYAFHPKADEDFVELWDFIAADSPNIADRVTNEIIARIESLVKFPRQGHKRTDLTSRPLRFVRVYDYLIAYAPDEQPLWIVAILHGSRNPRVMAAILRDRENGRN